MRAEAVELTGNISVSKIRLATVSGVMLLLAIVPPLVLHSFYTNLLTEAMILGLNAMALGLLMGYVGLVSFGHAAYFGVGAYVTALLLVKTGLPYAFWVTLLAGAAASAFVSLLTALICARTTGIAFAMLTLAVSTVFYTIVWKWRSLTGGDDGLIGVPRPPLELPGLSLGLKPQGVFYLLAFAFLLVCGLTLSRVISSPFGAVLQGIRENEERAEHLGYNVWLYKLLGFTIAGFFAGLAGGLYAMYLGFVSPDLLHWSLSAAMLVMVLVGGIGTLLGPILGALIMTLLREFASARTENWPIIVGGMLVLMVLFLPKGMYGLLRQMDRRRQK